MSSINTGKVVTGGLLAGLVLNILDIGSNALLMAEDFRANATRLNLDPAVTESTTSIATWVAVDFALGILIVWTYAAFRPRFGAGPKTAVIAGLTLFLVVTLVLLGLTQTGFFSMALFAKGTLVSLVIISVAAVVGAWAYKEVES